jgi:hypothetical protein
LQDYYYVRGFTPFAGSLLASAPDSHLETIVGGIAALNDELAWFKETAQKRGCDVTIIGRWAEAAAAGLWAGVAAAHGVTVAAAHAAAAAAVAAAALGRLMAACSEQCNTTAVAVTLRH